jgi:hypothetical protein
MSDTFPIRFLTLGGASVTVSETKDRFDRTVHPARCHGCGWEGPNFLDNARVAASMHANQCRSMPGGPQ